MRHKQQTSGRLRTANNTILKCFFQIHAPGKCFSSSIMSKFWWYTFHRQHKSPSSPEQRIFPLIFIATIRQIFCLSPLLLMHIRCQFSPSWIPFEHSNFSLRLQPHSPIKPDWSGIRDLNFDCVQFSGFRTQWCNARSSLSLSMYYWLTVFSPRAVNFSLGSLSTNWKYPHSQSASWNDFLGPSVQALPHPLHVSLARARSLFRLLLPRACYAG